MMSYNGDVYQGYAGSYESEAWGWGQQSWGPGYDQNQMQYDCSGWEYQQTGEMQQMQSPHHEQPNSEMEQHPQPEHQEHGYGYECPQVDQSHYGMVGPMVGDPNNCQVQTGMSPGHQMPTGNQMGQQQGQILPPSQPAPEERSTEQSTQQSQWNGSQGQQNSPSPTAGAEILTELRLAELKRLIDRDAQAIKQQDKVAPEPESKEPLHFREEKITREQLFVARHRDEPPSYQRPAGRTPANYPSEDDIHRPGTKASHPQPLGERYVVLASFSPENRRYKELPIQAGDEVWVSSEPVSEWIWAVKRHPFHDEGWVPAMHIGIGVDSDDEDYGYSDEDHHRVDHRNHGDHRWEDARYSPNIAGWRGPSSRENGGKEIMALLEQASWDAANSRGPREGKGARRPAAQPTWKGGPGGWPEDDPRWPEPPEERDEEEPWHHHGNWWSKQRHLKIGEEGGKGEGPMGMMQPLLRQGRMDDGPGPMKGGGRWAQEWQHEEMDMGRRFDRMSAPMMGKGPGPVKGNGKGPVERPQRQRAALSSLLDRLNKPLVAVKYDGRE